MINKENNSWVSCNSRILVNTVASRVRETARKNGNLEVMNGIVTYTGQEQDISSFNKTFLFNEGKFTRHIPLFFYEFNDDGSIAKRENTNGLTFPIRVMIHNQAIEHGLNIDWRHYNAIFGVATANMISSARAFIQALNRVRNVSNIMVGIKESIPSKQAKEEVEHECQEKNFLATSKDVVDISDGIMSRIAKHFYQEKQRSKRGFTAEFTKHVLRHPQHTVYIQQSVDGFEAAEGELKDRYRYIEGLLLRSQVLVDDDPISKLTSKLYDHPDRKQIMTILLTHHIAQSFAQHFERNTEMVLRLLKCVGFGVENANAFNVLERIGSCRPNPSTTSLTDFKAVATWFYENNANQRDRVNNMREVSIGDWVSLFNKWMKKHFGGKGSLLLINGKKERIRCQGKVLTFPYQIEPLLWRVMSAQVSRSSFTTIRQDVPDYANIMLSELEKELESIDERHEADLKTTSKFANGVAARTRKTHAANLQEIIQQHNPCILPVAEYVDLLKKSGLWYPNYINI